MTYWSLGNCTLTVTIIVGLIRKVNLTESVFETLTPISTKREVETYSKIVMVMKAGLVETKHSRTEQQRQEFYIELTYVTPPREGERSQDDMIRRICEQLDVRRGKRHLLALSHPHSRSFSTHAHSFAGDSGRKNT